jgi:hypothetical protein
VPPKPDVPLADLPRAIVTAPPVESRANPPRILRAVPQANQPSAASPPATQPAVTPDKLAALPPSETPAPRAAPRAAPGLPDAPQIAVIRGGRQRPAASRAPAAEKPKENARFAALPPGALAAPTATDAPPIIVLRGLRGPRYALVGRIEPPQPAAHPLLTVIRGARPRPVPLPHVQPGPLILRIPGR